MLVVVLSGKIINVYNHYKIFPPDVGGMQSLMWGLSKEMSKHFMIKVFADYHENHKEFDGDVNFSIERVGGIKFLER